MGQPRPRDNNLTELNTYHTQDATMPLKARRKGKMSQETCDDTQSITQGFVQLCQEHFVSSKMSITPGRVNSDICENMFCQQRAMCHGANDNPTHAMYATGLNTVILSQALISHKANAFGSSTPMSQHLSK